MSVPVLLTGLPGFTVPESVTAPTVPVPPSVALDETETPLVSEPLTSKVSVLLTVNGPVLVLVPERVSVWPVPPTVTAV